MLSSLGALFVLGTNPDWGAYDRPYRRRRVALPTYPFQRERYWLPVASADHARKQKRAAGHPLLGMHLPLAARPGEHIWCGEISLELCPWIADHRVQGAAVLPTTAYVEMAIAAAVEAGSELPVALTRIEIEKVLLLQPAIEFEIQTRLEQQFADIMVFQVHSRRKNTKEEWTLHASGAIRVRGITMSVAKFDASQRDAFEKSSIRFLDGPEFYRLHKARGNRWGPCFQGVSRVWQGTGEALSEVTVPVGIEGELSHYLFHPALFDSSAHILTATIPLEKSDDSLGGAFVGAGIEEVRVYRRPEGRQFYAYAQKRSHEASPDSTFVGDIKVFDFSGNLFTEILGARLRYLDSSQRHDVLESVVSENDAGTPDKTADGDSRVGILGAQSEIRAEIVDSYLAKQMARILKVPLVSVDRETPILKMGFDSLMSMELKNQLESDLGVSIAMSRLIQSPTLLELTGWVMDLLVTVRPVEATAAVDSSVSEFEEGVL